MADAQFTALKCDSPGLPSSVTPSLLTPIASPGAPLREQLPPLPLVLLHEPIGLRVERRHTPTSRQPVDDLTDHGGDPHRRRVSVSVRLPPAFLSELREGARPLRDNARERHPRCEASVLCPQGRRPLRVHLH